LALFVPTDIAISVKAKTALPILSKLDDLEDALADKSAIIRPVDDYAYLSQPDSAIPEKWCTLRDKAWEIIKDIVIIEPDIYISEARGKLITDIERIHHTYHRMMYLYLRKYWQRGLIKNALLPDYSNCGERDEGKKVGRAEKRSQAKTTKNSPSAQIAKSAVKKQYYPLTVDKILCF